MQFSRYIVQCILMVFVVGISTVSAKDSVKDMNIISSLTEVLEEIKFGKIALKFCYDYSYFLDPKKQRKVFPDNYYILPEDGKLFQELVAFSKHYQVEYCEQDYMAVVSPALLTFIEDEYFYNTFMPSMIRVANRAFSEEDLILVFDATDRAMTSYLHQARQPILDRYKQQVEDLHNRYWDCSSC